MPNIVEVLSMQRKSVTNKMQSDNSTALPLGGADSTFGTSNHHSSKAAASGGGRGGGGLFRKPTRREIHETHKRNMIALLFSVTTFCLLAIFGLSKTLFHKNDGIVDSNALNHAHVGAFSNNDMSKISAKIMEQQKKNVMNMNLDGLKDLGRFHNRRLPVDKFPFLKSVLDGAEMVGLYFAASWCPMSTPVTSMISGDMMPEAIGAATKALETVGANSGKSPIDIVYVSSDETAEQMDAYIDSEWTNWKSVPFDSDERTELKR